jgi:hypothetical protein
VTNEYATVSPTPTTVQPAPHAGRALEIAVMQSVATWIVRNALASGYKSVTGRTPPRARDADVTVRRILVWAAVTAVAISATDVVVDRFALRRDHTIH